MKKVLLASAALIASAGFAAADATVGGYGYAGVSYDGATDNVTVNHAVRLEFTASVETDNGISLTAYARSTISNNDGGDGTVDTTEWTSIPATAAEVDGRRVFEKTRIDIAAGGLSARIGSTNGAAKSLARSGAFYGYDDGGVVCGGANVCIDNNNSKLNDSGNNVLVQYTSGSFTIGVGSTIDGATQDIGVRYTSGNLTAGAGYSSDDEWMAMVSYGFGQGTATFGVSDTSAANTMQIVGILAYDIGSATTLGLGVEHNEGASDTSAYLDVSHDLGGATLSGTIGQDVAGTTRAGFGIFFGF